MPLSPTSFLGSHGFEENPFTTTNADDEPELQSYFVPPPYFSSVIGSPTKPKSAIVFAPRGGGKSAQKVMVEKAANRNDANKFLCVNYDTFLLEGKFTLEDANVGWHLRNICRLIILGLLLAYDEKDKGTLALNENEKNALARSATTFLSELTEAEFRDNIKALRNWRGQADHLWEKYGGKVVNLISAIAAKFDIGSFDKLADKAELNRNSIADYLKQLNGISKSFGFHSIYILIDRVDEVAITTNNAKNSFEFIKSLLLDLHVLEMDGYAYKFFLWDQSKQYFFEAGARPDRIPIHELDWTVSQLREMLSKRLLAFSGQKVSSLNQLIGDDVQFDLDDLVCYLAAGSPRDMIRQCQKVIDEQTKATDETGNISLAVVDAAVKSFSTERSNELYAQYLPDFRRIGAGSFTIAKIASDIFRVSAQAARSKVQKWQDAGAVSQSGEVPNPGNRPYYLFSFSDPRLVVLAIGNQPLIQTLETAFSICPQCSEFLVSHREGIVCSSCGTPAEPKDNLLRYIHL